jgi:hypothetical protein
MDSERIAFLYGVGVEADGFDFSDPDIRAELMKRTLPPELSELQRTMREVIANQILDDEPPEVWSTVQRLRAGGSDREAILRELVLTFAPVVKRALEEKTPADPDTYLRALSWLPLPSRTEIEDAVTRAVSAAPGVATDELVEVVRERLHRDGDDAAAEDLIDRVIDQLVDDGPMAWASGDRLVHVGALTGDIVLTHVLTDAERDLGVVNASFDLAGFDLRERLILPNGEPLTTFSAEHGHLGWMGPPGWLDHCPGGSTVAFRVDPAGNVQLEALPQAPHLDDALVARLRAVYDREVEIGLPVHGEELLVGLLLDEPDAFQVPAAPLAELAEAAGLERRLDRVAHDDHVWHRGLHAKRTWHLFDAFGPADDRVHQVLRALDIADLISGIDPDFVPNIERPVDTTLLRRVLADLEDEETLSALADELFDNDDPAAEPRAEAFVDALVSAASRPREIATARLLAAFHAEWRSEPLVAEQHLKLAHQADGQMGLVTDRLAWYASDRGDAVAALRLWRELAPSPAFAQDLHEVEQFAAPTRAQPSRNDACWCGSGRKFKQCHLGSVDLPPLPERVGWLCRKAVAYIERGAPQARGDVIDMAYARATDPDDERSVNAAFDDPIVLDLVLTEAGWFEHFLEDRGPLLPDDEALLAQSWLLVPRTVYEVVAKRPGVGLELRDLRTAEVVDVRERTFSREVSVGALVCARAVPDGDTHQFVGGLFPVTPGREGDLLDLLDDGDPEAIARWVAALHRPPELRTREGESLVECEVLIELTDVSAAREFLDTVYEPDESIGSDPEASWVELFPLNEDEDVVRARLAIEGSQLRVQTNSEERVERVLAAILPALPTATIVGDVRTPLDLSRERTPDETEEHPVPIGSSQQARLDDPAVAEAVTQMRDRYEERWCDEPVPALGGWTPREAAADPTRRETLERLLNTFGHRPGAQDSPGAMRPERLRELLDL